MKVSLVAAVAENAVIGCDGKLPWHLPDDFRRFRELTTGHHVIMGRRTFESLGRPLRDRVNLVLTRSTTSLPAGVHAFAGLEAALAFARAAGESEAFVIGGTSVYAAALPLADTVHLTRVHARVEGDARFPDLVAADWTETEREHHPADDRHAHPFTYVRLERARPRPGSASDADERRGPAPGGPGGLSSAGQARILPRRVAERDQSSGSRPAARLLVRAADGREVETGVAEELTLGRLPENDVVLDDPAVSRRHAVIRAREGGSHVLMDLGSANGTIVDDRRIEIPTPLRDGDTVRIAGYTLIYRTDTPASVDPGATEEDDRTLHDRFVDRPQLLGTSRAMAPVFDLIEQAARSPIPVLVEGETGTGKELVARAIHRASARAEGPFVAINCAAIAENLLESELFGHRRGAFTGADRDRKGLFEAAHGGSVFLDEIGEMPLGMQPKLLRVLQEGEIVPVGETRPRTVDVRILSATNRDLLAQTEDGSFRSDLYYRLAAFPIRIPPLRDRREDIPLIADRLLKIASYRHDKRLAGIAPDALELLVQFDWPGNVRELQNEMERGAAIARNGEALGAAHLSERVRAGPSRPPQEADEAKASSRAPTAPLSETGPLRNARAAFESRYITQVLTEQGGNVTRAARVLGLSRYALQKKIKEYGLR